MAIFKFAQCAIHHMALHVSGSQMHFQIIHHNIFKDERWRRQKLFVTMKKTMPHCTQGDGLTMMPCDMQNQVGVAKCDKEGNYHCRCFWGVVYTMEHEVVSRPCKICDWLLNSSKDHYSLQQGKNVRGTMEFEVPIRQFSRPTLSSDTVQIVSIPERGE